MLIQINQKTKFSLGMSKRELKSLADQNNKSIKDWDTKDVSVDELVTILARGEMFRAGILKGGNSKENTTIAEWLPLDFDKSSVKDILENPYSDYACIWYHTPGYIPGENEKFRLIFKLSESVERAEYEALYRILVNLYGNSPDNCFSPAQGFFGAYSPEHVHVIKKKGEDGKETNEYPELPVKTLLNMFDTVVKDAEEVLDNYLGDDNKESLPKAKKSKSKRTSQTPQAEKPKRENFTTKILKYLNDTVFEGACQGDVRKLFTLWDHNLKAINKDNKIQAEKWQGRLAGSNNPDGTGLVVTVNNDNNGLPPTYIDRSQGGRVHNIVEYWHHAKRVLDTATFPEKLGNCFCKVVDDICDHFGVPRFDYSTNMTFMQKIKYFCDEDHIMMVRCWDLDRELKYLYFDQQVKIWKFINLTNMVQLYLAPTFKNKYDNWYEELAEYAANSGMKKIPTLQSVLKGHLVNNNPGFCHKHPQSNPRLVLLNNGVYNLDTHELEPNVGQVFNFHEPPNINYKHVDDDHPVIVRLKSYFEDWLGDKAQGNLLLSYLVLCVRRDAYRMRKMLLMMGTSTKGKSTYGSLIQNIMNGTNSAPETYTAAKFQVGDICTSNDHASAAIEGKYLLYLDEINNIDPARHNIENLKVFISEEHDRNLNINPKYERQRVITSYAAIVGTSEDVLKVNTSDGLDNRIVYACVDEDTNMSLKKDIEYLKANTEIIHNWCLQQDSEDYIEMFETASQNEKVKANLLDKKRFSEPLCEFFELNLTLTNNPNDAVDSDLIWFLFQEYRKTYHCDYNYKSSQTFCQRFSKVIKESKYGINWKGTRKKASGRTTKPKYTHMKVINDDVFKLYAQELESKK